MLTNEYIVNRLYELNAEKDQLTAKLKRVSEEQKALKDTLLEDFLARNIQGIKTSVARAYITTTTVAKVEDWPSFYNFVKSNDAFYLLAKHPASAQIQDYNTVNQTTVPGTTTLTLRNITVKGNV